MKMSSRSRSDNNTEVVTARSRLDGVLQTLVDKKDDSIEIDVDIQIKEEPTEDSPVKVSTPRKSTISTPGSSTKSPAAKKRKRKDDGPGGEMGQYHHTYVMKLFDRSVDLAQFTENTPLYPVCRAWIRNQPHNRELGIKRLETPEPEELSDEEEAEGPKNVYRLPAPLGPVKREPGHAFMHTDLRVPSPVPQPDLPLDVHADQDQAPPAEQLLLNHMVRWKEIRQKWKVQSIVNEARYAESLHVIKDIYDYQMQQ
ncbi:protein lin-37 homolog [Lingula anatina]|uniref:Protein lin-37 homolog n=1 Tax=Lingula anatina TaxID=7574 RepID=A0A1S3JBI2_LINAN|nr:protein lin-37 homolog [Lingula anatina]XP_013416843.1 protein lin-37 homolog [Lingula anatina]|eukprot:XP_013407765.1 protein lin-37 homolog [Lingula anatina]